METSSKKELALAFLTDLVKMSPEKLQKIIKDVVGEDLASVMFGYAKQVLQASPDKAIENASSLMLLGYLIRVHEQGQLPSDTPTA